MQEFRQIEPEGGEEEAGQLESIDQALEQIDRLLHQMLLLAGISASGSAVDRQALQRALDRLRHKIDGIADSIR